MSHNISFAHERIEKQRTRRISGPHQQQQCDPYTVIHFSGIHHVDCVHYGGVVDLITIRRIGIFSHFLYNAAASAWAGGRGVKRKSYISISCMQ